eukprot:s1027_g9.t1
MTAKLSHDPTHEVLVVDPRDLETPDPEAPSNGQPAQLKAYVVCQDPRIVVVPRFFSQAECQHLLELVQGSWIPSLVGSTDNRSEEDYDKGNLENTLASTRTSWSCMLRYAQTSIVERLEHRLCALGCRELETLERMNMVRYAPGEYFKEHHDGKFRPLTVFVYLNDLDPSDDAGDTFFPALGISFRPRQGAAVLWSNIIGEQDSMEDARLLHAGRPPQLGVKYGVNCFFNCKRMRQLVAEVAEFPYETSTVVDVRGLGRPGTESKLIAYKLCDNPKLVAVKRLISEDEAAHFLEMLGKQDLAPRSDVEGDRTLRLVGFAETAIVKAVEERLTAVGGFSVDLLGPLRIVQTSSQRGLCNRGCGHKSAYICLSDADEVFFYRVGMRLRLKRGDALLWPNVEWSTEEEPLEDLRTLRVHVLGEDGQGVGISASFYDAEIRKEQRRRRFHRDGLSDISEQTDLATA